MSRLHEKLTENYAGHYQRVNIQTNPRLMSPHVKKGMQAQYGNLIQSQQKPAKMLDLGCGTGILTYWLSQQNEVTVVGVDSSPTQINRLAEWLPEVEAVHSDGLDYLRNNSNTFNGIFCTDVLEHLPEDTMLAWVEAARDALQPGGFFYCRVPNAANLTGSYSRYMDLTHQRSFTRTSLLQLLEVGGLEGCQIVPVKSARLAGRLRLLVEAALHRIVFAIVGQRLETVFTINVQAVGFKPTHRA